MIDVGEDEPRQILSGLRKFFTADQMLNRRVAVVCNVKASAMGGISSCGFVLCATKGEGETAQVEFINPPAGAKNGERIFPESLKGTELPAPYSGAAMKKKKVMRKIVLKTAEGDAGPFAALCDGETLMTSAGPCVSDTLSGAKII